MIDIYTHVVSSSAGEVEIDVNSPSSDRCMAYIHVRSQAMDVLLEMLDCYVLVDVFTLLFFVYM